MIPIIFLRCDWKRFVWCIQTVNTDSLPPKVCGRLWQGWWLSVTYCWPQSIDFLDLKYPLRSSHYPYFFDLWLVYIAFNGTDFTDTEIFNLVWLKIVCGSYLKRTYGFSSTKKVCGRLWRGCKFYICTCNNQFIEFIKVNHPRFFIVIVVYKATILRESYQGALTTIGLIPLKKTGHK